MKGSEEKSITTNLEAVDLMEEPDAVFGLEHVQDEDEQRLGDIGAGGSSVNVGVGVGAGAASHELDQPAEEQFDVGGVR